MSEKRYYGLYQGIVTNIDDPEKRGRIKVICPDVLGGETESAWCDPLVPVAYDNGGDFCIPNKNEAVWLQFIAGDVNRPVYQGGWWQKEKTPLGTNYIDIDKLRIIKYADCTIVMQNGKIDINTNSGEFDLRIQDGHLTINGNLTVNGEVSAQSLVVTTGVGTITTKSVTTDIVKSTSINTNSIDANSVDAGNIEATSIDTSSLDSNTISANSVSATSVEASGVSLSEHTHGGVYSGSSNTSKPN